MLQDLQSKTKSLKETVSYISDQLKDEKKRAEEELKRLDREKGHLRTAARIVNREGIVILFVTRP